MADIKKSKPVQTDINLETASIGSVPTTGVDAVPSVIHGSQSGILFISHTNSAGTAEVTVVADNAAVSGTPAGAFMGGIYRSTLPTYANNDAAVSHFDSRGRFIVANVNATSGATADVDQDDTAAPANPVGTFPLAKYQSALPTYTSGDAAVLHADENGRLLTRNPASGATLSSVAGTASSTTLLAANSARLGATIYNDSTAELLVKFGATASSSSFTVAIGSDGYFETPFSYTGRIDGIWGSATGDARITEITA